MRELLVCGVTNVVVSAVGSAISRNVSVRSSVSGSVTRSPLASTCSQSVVTDGGMSGSVAVPEIVTVVLAPRPDWSAPALALGAWLRTVTTTVSGAADT